MPKQFVFVSHSQNDKRVMKIVRKSFKGLRSLRPFFFERKLVPRPPSVEIVERIRSSSAFFAFLTRNSTEEKTRDWIVFELAVAVAFGKTIYAWKGRNISAKKIPRFLEQVTTYHDFEVATRRGKNHLTREVQEAARAVYANMKLMTTANWQKFMANAQEARHSLR